jgi:copper oxidase (laccase) domain-containing protein
MPGRVASSRAPVEFYPALADCAGIKHGFIGRIPGIDVVTDREEALARLDSSHRRIRSELGLGETVFLTAEQVHGNQIAVIETVPAMEECIPGVDGLITKLSSISLGIYVADCCAVFLVDPVRSGIGLVHSGRKGTELQIVPRAIAAMKQHFGSAARDLIVQLSPAIRPPHYEVDFTAEIVRQVRAQGVDQIYDSGQCTACDLERYYSYRAEKGRTGRMLALLALREGERLRR